jgi:hypothetical protein
MKTKTKRAHPTNRKEKRTARDPFPLFCDYACIHASFPPTDAVGACRKEAGVYCTLLKRYNNKNAACLARTIE